MNLPTDRIIKLSYKLKAHLEHYARGEYEKLPRKILEKGYYTYDDYTRLMLMLKNIILNDYSPKEEKAKALDDLQLLIDNSYAQLTGNGISS